MTDILVTSPYRPFTLPNQFKAVFNGYIYCGTVGAVDPSVSQVQVYLANEDGSRTPVAQPLRTNAGGFLVYSGQPAKFVTDANHSLLVRDSLGVQVWYEPDMAIADPESLVSQLGGDDGFSFASFKPTGVEGAIKRTLAEWAMDSVSVDPKWFGAKGDWDETTQTGTDDTAAFQAAINFLASLPTQRQGRGRVLKPSAGCYMTRGLVVPQSFVFGFNLIGESRESTIIYCNPANPATTPGILSEVEFVVIDKITIAGSAKSILIDTANYVTDLIKIELPDGRADCDLFVGEEAKLVNAKNLITLHGRGLMFHGVAGLATNLLNIVCSPNQKWTAGSAINDFNTGMRNYQISGCRFDQMNSLVTVTGSGPALDYVHGIRINNNDILGIASLVSAPTATLREFSMQGNTALDSGNVDVVNCGAMVGGLVSSNTISKKVNCDTAPTINNDQLPRVVRSAGAIKGLKVNGNVFGAMRDTVVSAGAESSDVQITSNTFFQAFILGSGTVFSGANCSSLVVEGNAFTGASMAMQPWSRSVQTSLARSKNNSASVKFLHPGLGFTPTINKGGAAVTPTVSLCDWSYDGYYCTARYAISAPMGGAGGTINISTPMTPLAEFPALTGAVAGGGAIQFFAGGAIAFTARVLTSGSINLIVASTGAALAGTDVPSTLSAEFEVKFKA